MLDIKTIYKICSMIDVEIDALSPPQSWEMDTAIITLHNFKLTLLSTIDKVEYEEAYNVFIESDTKLGD